MGLAQRSLTGGDKSDAGTEEEPEEQHTEPMWVHLKKLKPRSTSYWSRREGGFPLLATAGEPGRREEGSPTAGGGGGGGETIAGEGG